MTYIMAGGARKGRIFGNHTSNHHFRSIIFTYVTRSCLPAVESRPLPVHVPTAVNPTSSGQIPINSVSEPGAEMEPRAPPGFDILSLNEAAPGGLAVHDEEDGGRHQRRLRANDWQISITTE
jgi:hypothetical protein